MEVRTISTEIIKPSSPTPSHLRVHNLSVLDQLNPDVYFPVLLFYSELASKSTTKASQFDLLRKSLSETLTHYYPFAGRVNDDKSVNCDDSGAIFIEAHVTNEMSGILKQPQMAILEKLCPYNVSNDDPLGSDQPILAVQINCFDCGGVAIAVCFRHVIADASAAANFIKNWVAIARGGSDHHIINNDIVFDCSSIFPPQEISGLMKSLFDPKRFSTKEIIRKRYTFDGAKIAALRDKINEGSCNLDCLPTRFEAVSTLILSAVIAAVKERDQSSACPKYLAALILMNLRKKMNPPFPEQCIGNIYQPTVMTWPIKKTISDYKCVAAKLQEAIKMIDDNFVRKLHEGGAFVDQLRNTVGSILNGTEVQFFTVSSWCRFPFYEADFGWGKPIWVSTASSLNNMAFLLDSCDGQGIEAWVGLFKEDMEKFEQELGIMTYATLNPSK